VSETAVFAQLDK